MEKNILSFYQRPKAIDIDFENLWLTVKVNGGYKKIIKGVSGKFKSGELTAIMGPSGAGKTSLLNVLTGYQTDGVQGVIKCTNGKKRKKGTSQYKNDSCYILQDDHLMAFFSVYEIMYSTTKLKIDGLSKLEMDILIDDILNTLGLYNSKNTPCGNLSGGQKKRLSIALELIDDPPVMFLDEPTTGLDSSSSKQCVQMLKSLAEKGRTIVCTIHQPSAPLYMTFSHVYIVAEGTCVYRGAPSNTVSFLTSVGFICPQYHNPADFFLEVTTGEYGDSIERLAAATKEPHWRNSITLPETKENEKEAEMITNNIAYEEDNNTICRFKRTPSEWSRFFILLKKQIVYLYRDWTVARLKLLLHFLVGIFLGITFQNCGYDASRTITNISFFLVSVVYLSYTSLMPAALRFPAEVEILKKEHFNQWYKLRTYYASFLAADIPIQIVFTFAYTSMSYWISSQPLECYRFFMVFLNLSMVALISSSMGLVFGTLVNPINGTFLGAITTALMFSLGGVLCLFPHMNKFMYFLSNISYMSFALDGLIQAVYGFNRPPLICPEEKDYCLFTSPTELLEEVGMNKMTYWGDVGYLMLNFLVLRFLAYCTLRRKLRAS